jgi:hypothetical protein
MGVLELEIKNGEDNVELKVNSIYLPIWVSEAKNASNLVYALDNTNKCWVSNHLTETGLKYARTIIDENVTYLDKGVIIDNVPESPAQIAVAGTLNALAVKKFTADSGNIIGWTYLYQLTPTTFRFGVSIYDTLNVVDSITIDFDEEFNDGLPVPSSPLLTLPSVVHEVYGKVFTVNNFTFDDVNGAVDQAYVMDITFKNSLDSTVAVFNTTLTVEGLDIA